MRCPHCQSTKKCKVLESRPHDGQVFRRRMCSTCFKTFVSREEAPEGLKMPNATQSKFRITDQTLKPGQDGVIRNTGEHLRFIWK
jgi:transcriptional regulator NrdR family protein